MIIRDYPIAIIGAGPVGMAAAAHLTERNIPFRLFEAGMSIGANLLDWGHVRVFSPWRYNVDKAARRLLQELDWNMPDEDGLPTGSELVSQYLLPLSFHPKIEPYLHLSTEVQFVTKKGIDKMKTAGRENIPFIIQVKENGILRSYEASGVIDASGTWSNPNPIGSGGIFAKGEMENASRISYRIPDILGKDQKRYANKNVMVVGSGHSAINSLLDLAALKKDFPQTKIHWALLTENFSSIYGGKENDALKARGALGTRIERLVKTGQLAIHSPYLIHEIVDHEGKMNIKGIVQGDFQEISQVDEIIANTGGRPNLSMLREVRVQTDPALESVAELAELIDPNIHSCGSVRAHGELELRQPEPNLYIVGVKSYGRAPTFLMATGYEQVRSIAASLAGDVEAAKKVELDLPETGVCNSATEEREACCDSNPPANESSNEGRCCSKSISDHLNIEIMKKEEKDVQLVEASGCCGGAATKNEDACCKLDEEKKEVGEEGCGCNSLSVNSKSPVKTSSCC